MANNYVLGRGKLYFDRFAADTTTGTGERYLGNTTEVVLAVAVENLEHYSSDEGIRIKDMSVETQRTRSGRFTTDNITGDNLGLIFGAEPTNRTTTEITDDGDTLTVQRGYYYQLGTRAHRPEGVTNVSSVLVRDNTGVKATGTLTFSGQPTADDTLTINGVVITFKASGATGNQVNLGGSATLTAQAVKAFINDHPDELQVVATGASTVITLTAVTAGTWANTLGIARSGTHPSLSASALASGTNGGTIPSAGNWTVDETMGRLYIEEDSNIANDDILVVSYDVETHTEETLTADDLLVEGALRYIADNPEGDDRDFFIPRVKLSPTGDLPMKGDTWLSVTMTFEVLTLGTYKQVYWRKR
jgi:hypothetical protein